MWNMTRKIGLPNNPIVRPRIPPTIRPQTLWSVNDSPKPTPCKTQTNVNSTRRVLSPTLMWFPIPRLVALFLEYAADRWSARAVAVWSSSSSLRPCVFMLVVAVSVVSCFVLLVYGICFAAASLSGRAKKFSMSDEMDAGIREKLIGRPVT